MRTLSCSAWLLPYSVERSTYCFRQSVQALSGTLEKPTLDVSLIHQSLLDVWKHSWMTMVANAKKSELMPEGCGVNSVSLRYD